MSAVEKSVTENDKNKYDALDQAIIAAIAAGKNRHIMFRTDPGIEKEVLPFVKGRTLAYQVIDARTQSLRKRGFLAFDQKTGWKVCQNS